MRPDEGDGYASPASSAVVWDRRMKRADRMSSAESPVAGSARRLRRTLLAREAMQLRCRTVENLIEFVAAQLAGLFPCVEKRADVEALNEIASATLERLRPILAAVRAFEPNVFDHFNSLQYATFLYLLASEASRRNPDSALADRLFCLNRALNSIDLFYAVQLPEVFFISHGLGTVLGNVSYGNRLVVFQGVTIGRVGNRRPVIGDNVVIYPGATISGSSVIGSDCVVGAGVVLHNQIVPPASIVSLRAGVLELRKATKSYARIYFRD